MRPRGRAKASAPKWEVEGNKVSKNTALFSEARVKNPLYVPLYPDPPTREERRKDERQRRERDERDGKKKRDKRDKRNERERDSETVRQQ